MVCSFKDEQVLVTLLVLLVTTLPNNCAVCKDIDRGGPSTLFVQLTRSYVQADLKAPQVQLGLLLDGYRPQEEPVRVTVKWSKFGHKGASNREMIEWDSGSLSATKNLTLRWDVSLLENPLEDFILAEIVHTSYGSIDQFRGSTIVGLAKEDDLPEFAVGSGDVIAAGESANLSVHLVSGSVLGDKPALISYAFKALKDPDMEKYFSNIVPTNGIISFAPGETVKYISLSVRWERVPPEARYHIAMAIYPIFKARVSNRDPVVAVHLLGTTRGACPPGSSLGKTSDEEKELVVKSLIRVQSERDDSVKHSDLALSLYDRDGSSIPLFKEESGHSSRVGALVENRMDSVWVCIASRAKQQLEYRSYTLVKDVKSSSCPKSMAKFSRGQVAGYRVDLPVGLTEFCIHGEDRLAISILRQGDARHTLLRALKIHPSHGEPFLACESYQDGGAEEPIYRLKHDDQTTPDCVPGEPVSVVLHHRAENVRIVPEMLVPSVPSIRIEMNGRVVTQHQARTGKTSDTYPGEDDQHTNGSSKSVSTEAYIMTLPAGYEIPVDVVVFGEDGTSSSKYTLILKREPESDNSLALYSRSIPKHPNLAGIIEGVDGFAQCQGCAPGWYSFEVDAKICKLCPPGTYAEENGYECIPCPKGTYSVSWGSNRCKHCIEGTVAATVRSTSCSLCPESVTTNGDGQWACDVAVDSMDMSHRYAVMIYVTVHVSGIDEDAIILKAGVDASPHRVLSNLIKSDMVKAFNTSNSAVNIMSVRRMPNSYFEANVSTSLPVYIPPSATEEDISAALEIEKLSADSPLELLERDPDAFFGRTTEILNVHVESTDVRTEDHFPEPRNSGLMIGLLLTGTLCLLGGISIVVGAIRRHRRGKAIERSTLLGLNFQHSSA